MPEVAGIEAAPAYEQLGTRTVLVPIPSSSYSQIAYTPKTRWKPEWLNTAAYH